MSESESESNFDGIYIITRVHDDDDDTYSFVYRSICSQAGMRTAYKTGQYIRRRYKDLLSERYNESEIHIRSTEFSRTTMTALTSMAAVYPQTKSNCWTKKINWVPVPYFTVPLNDDILRSTQTCPLLKNLLEQARKQPADENWLEKYGEVVKKVAEVFKNEEMFNTYQMYFLYSYLKCLVNQGIPMNQELKDLLPKIQEASELSLDAIIGNESYARLGGGTVLHEFFKHAHDVITGVSAQKLRIYFAHETSIILLATSCRVRRGIQYVPDFGGLLSLELRRVEATGRYVVLVVYLSDPHDGVQKYLEIDGCGELLCDFKKFHQLTAKYLIDHDTWRKECGYNGNQINTPLY